MELSIHGQVVVLAEPERSLGSSDAESCYPFIQKLMEFLGGHQVSTSVQRLLAFFYTAFHSWLLGLSSPSRSEVRIAVVSVYLFKTWGTDACVFFDIQILVFKPLVSIAALCFHLNGVGVLWV